MCVYAVLVSMLYLHLCIYYVFVSMMYLCLCCPCVYAALVPMLYLRLCCICVYDVYVSMMYLYHVLFYLRAFVARRNIKRSGFILPKLQKDALSFLLL